MPFSPSVRKMRCSQAERAVLRQDTAVLKYVPRVIRIMRAQQSAPFPGRAPDVLARLHLGDDRHAWVQVVRGAVRLNGTSLTAGDGAAVSQETGLRIQATDAAELLLFDLA